MDELIKDYGPKGSSNYISKREEMYGNFTYDAALCTAIHEHGARAAISTLFDAFRIKNKWAVRPLAWVAGVIVRRRHRK